jgi:hypothetical protein
MEWSDQFINGNTRLMGWGEHGDGAYCVEILAAQDIRTMKFLL